jgi:hypothetical protein
MRHLFPCLLLLLIAVSGSVKAQTQIFVATTGNDNTGDGSISNPYATIKKAAEVANDLIIAQPTIPVDVLVRAGTFRNPGFSTTMPLDPNSYDPQNAGEAIWKTDAVQGTVVRLVNINGNSNAWITIKPYQNEQVLIEGDGDNTFSIRNCSYLRVSGFEIKGVLERIPLVLAWKYWGTYRYLVSGNYTYADRKIDICNTAGIIPCVDIPPLVLLPHTTYSGLPDISSLNVERPNIFGGKGLLVQLSHHVEILNNNIHHFPVGFCCLSGQ